MTLSNIPKGAGLLYSFCPEEGKGKKANRVLKQNLRPVHREDVYTVFLDCRKLMSPSDVIRPVPYTQGHCQRKEYFHWPGKGVSWTPQVQWRTKPHFCVHVGEAPICGTGVSVPVTLWPHHAADPQIPGKGLSHKCACAHSRVPPGPVPLQPRPPATWFSLFPNLKVSN